MVTVEFENTLQKNAEAIVFTYAMARIGFYVKRGFYVLPSIPAKYKHKNIIILPDFIDYRTLNTLISSNCYYRSGYGMSPEKYPKAVNFVKKQLVDLGYNKEPNKEYKQELADRAIKYTKKLQKSLTYLRGKDILIKISIKNFGSGGSFNSLEFKDINKQQLVIGVHFREGRELNGIAESISSALTVNAVLNMGAYKWRETEAVSDFFTKYVLGADDVTLTLETLNKPNKVLLKKSIKYLHQIGLNNLNLVEYDSTLDTICIAGNDATKSFSSYEFNVIKTLAQNKGKIVTFDDLATALYGEKAELEFSLWGISKCVSRIRLKLQKYGLPKDTVRNVKGIGYKLIN